MEYRANLFLKESRVLVVVSKFNDLITERLVQSAKNTLLGHGVLLDHINVVYVPGAFEIPQLINVELRNNVYDGAIGLGCVIRGETSHYEHICSSVSNALMNISLENKKPVSFGLLTVNTLDQAFDRAGGKLGNKGAESAVSLVEMMDLFNQLKTSVEPGKNVDMKKNERVLKEEEDDFY